MSHLWNTQHLAALHNKPTNQPSNHPTNQQTNKQTQTNKLRGPDSFFTT